MIGLSLTISPSSTQILPIVVVLFIVLFNELMLSFDTGCINDLGVPQSQTTSFLIILAAPELLMMENKNGNGRWNELDGISRQETEF